jgi:hypothetical protein
MASLSPESIDVEVQYSESVNVSQASPSLYPVHDDREATRDKLACKPILRRTSTFSGPKSP